MSPFLAVYRAVTELQEGGATYPGPYTGILKTFLSTLGYQVLSSMAYWFCE